MSKAEEFIKNNTNNQANISIEISNGGKMRSYSQPWLTPDQTRKAMEIAREEIYDWLSDNVFDDKYLDLRKMGIEHAFYGYKVDTLINDLKQAMKDE